MSVVDMLPRHAKIRLDLTRMIMGMEIGARVLPERELCAHFNVSRETIRRAMRALTETHILESRQGSGTFVRRHPEVTESALQQTKLIGLSMPTVERLSIARIVRGAEEAAAETGFRIVLSHDFGDPALQFSQIRGMIQDGIDGLIAFLDQDNVSRPESRSLLREFEGGSRKLVLVDRYIPEVAVPCVMTDTVQGMYELMKHLIATGRRRFAVISWGDAAGIAERDRFDGFRRALREHGLRDAPVLHAAVGYKQSQDISAREIVTEWVEKSRGRLPFDAIVCFVDEIAYGAFQALKAAGINVPEDVALTGFDNVSPEFYEAVGLDLTTVEQPFAEIGRQAVTRLLALMNGGPSGSEHTFLAPRLIIRKSSTPPKVAGPSA